MDDLIYRWEAIDAMTAENLSWNMDSVHDDDLKRAARAAQRALARLPEAQQWIPVTERLPEAKQMVLVTTFRGGVYYGFMEPRGKFYTANNMLADSWCWEPDVTHWMQLPEPPKEK